MILRIANDKDLKILCDMIDNYHGEFSYGIILDNEKLKTSLFTTFKGQVIVGIVNEEIIGFIAYLITQSFFTTQKIFVAMLFYIHPTKRKYTTQFMDSLNDFLKGKDITHIVFSSPASEVFDKMNRFYRMQGYKELERHFQKAVN